MATLPKILYILTKSNFGGAQRYVYDLARGVSHLYEPVVAAGGSGLLFKKLQENAIRTISIPSLERDIHVWNEWRALWSLVRAIKKEKPHIVHLNSSKIGILGAIACAYVNITTRTRIHCIFTIHGFPFREKRSLFFKIGTWILSWITLLIVNRAIAVSEKDLADARRMPFVTYKVSCVHNGIEPFDTERNFAHRDTLCGSSHYRNSFLIASIGELTKNKGYDYALEALSQIHNNNVLWVVVGDGEELSSLKKKARECGVEHKILWRGFLEDASAYISECDLFILPSLKEGLPYALLEAGNAGVAAIASNTGGVPEIITDKVSGLLIPPGNSGALAHAIEEMIRNPQKRILYKRALQETVRKNYNLKEMIEKTLVIYRLSHE